MWTNIAGWIQVTFKIAVLLIMFVLEILPLCGFSQETDHSFKITGKDRIEATFGASQERSVEYDANSSDHLYISDFRKNGFLLQKTNFLFKGKKFNLMYLTDYLWNKELQRDGLQIIYSGDESVASELLFKENTLLKQTDFYPNGNKMRRFEGDEAALNGDFKTWYENGQLSFSGNYQNNKKEGHFESFDEVGNLISKGIYKEGKLISGEPVVQDLEYETAEVSAQYIDGESAFSRYLKLKTADLAVVKEMDKDVLREINLKLTLDQFGQISKMEIPSSTYSSDNEIIDAVFDKFPGFKPALMEGVPVRSIRKMAFLLSHEGLQTYAPRFISTVENMGDSTNRSNDAAVEEMPEFPGGDMEMRKWIARSLRYPPFAQEHDIKGRVYVQFIIMEDGSIADISILKSVHATLDVEAMRVIQTMPKWKPARQNGKPVRVSFTVPIKFGRS